MPVWGMKGKMMAWISSREGLSNPSRGGQGDVYAMFFDKEAFDRFNLSKEDFKLLKKEEKKDSIEQKMDMEKEGKNTGGPKKQRNQTPGVRPYQPGNTYEKINHQFIFA